MTISPETAPNSRVLIWRNLMLPGSETFIRNQFDSMRTWTPQLAGLTRVPSALSTPSDLILFGTGRAEHLRRRAFRLLRWSPRVNRIVRAAQADLIHAHFGPDAITIFPTARRLKLPLVVTVHGYDVTSTSLLRGFHGWRYRRRVRKVFDYATTIIAVSEFIRDQAINVLGADPDKVVIHHIGIPIRSPQPPESADAQWDVAFVGRLVAKKGVDDLLTAVAALPAPLAGTRVAIVGDGALRSELEKHAKELGVDATFFGSQPPNVVASVLGQSRIFVGPSRTAASGDSEGFGMVFLEAAAASLPVIAYSHGGVPEAVEHTVTGLLAPESDVHLLSAQISQLLNDPALAVQLGANGRERVLRSFNVVDQTRLLERIYDDSVSL